MFLGGIWRCAGVREIYLLLGGRKRLGGKKKKKKPPELHQGVSTARVQCKYI
jgi:hypothetical protein